MMNGRNSNRFPFTASQWQELEHQALIYKYMASGTSIPPHLLFTIKRTYLDPPPPFSSSLFPHHHHPQHFGWNYLQMGLGRKIEAEPGRCRRTDGKKWRCSKDAYPDSKYCQSHMHRGKNRSRKPVELFNTTSPAASSAVTTTTTSTNVSSSSSSSSIAKHSPASLTTPYHYSLSPQHSSYASHLHHSFLSHHHLPSRRPAAGFSLEENSAPLFLHTASSSHTNNTHSRYVYGEKEDHVDEHAFFTEPSGAMKGFSASSMEDSWQLTPLTMSSSSSSSSCSKQRSGSSLSNDYSYLQLQSLSDHSKHHQEQQDQGCYMFGGGDHIKCGKDQEPHHHQKTVHRFFDEWSHKGLDLDDKYSSTTQLSISIPTSAYDFPNLQFKNPPW